LKAEKIRVKKGNIRNVHRDEFEGKTATANISTINVFVARTQGLVISHGVSGFIHVSNLTLRTPVGNGGEVPRVLNFQHWPEIGRNVAQIALPIRTEARLTAALVCMQLQTEKPVPVPGIESTSRNAVSSCRCSVRTAELCQRLLAQQVVCPLRRMTLILIVILRVDVIPVDLCDR